MRVLVISNDLVDGFGVPVAAPGLRAMGLAEGLTAHGHDVSLAVPEDVLGLLFGSDIPEPPNGVHVVAPPKLMAHISEVEAEVVVFINSNLSPHLQRADGVHFVYDLFAPKVLEGLASKNGGRPFADIAAEKERALALADEVWVNGERKMGYALGWLLRDGVDHHRTHEFAKPSLRDAQVAEMLCLVEMPVPLPPGIRADDAVGSQASGVRLGIAGYAQLWSSLSEVAPGHEILVQSGHELHALLPQHWAGSPGQGPKSALPSQTIMHEGPLAFDEFGRWVQSMDAMVDLFEPSAERTFAMITRSAVALRLGVPLIHAVDSEISDLISAYNAGWVLDPGDIDGWNRVAQEVADPALLLQKREGAKRVSVERLSPEASLATAATRLHVGQ